MTFEGTGSDQQEGEQNHWHFAIDLDGHLPLSPTFMDFVKSMANLLHRRLANLADVRRRCFTQVFLEAHL